MCKLNVPQRVVVVALGFVYLGTDACTPPRRAGGWFVYAPNADDVYGVGSTARRRARVWGMDDQTAGGGSPPRARTGRGRWTSFVAECALGPAVVVRGLHEQTNPRHRIRVEHDAHTLLIHLSDEDGAGWTTIAVDRDSRRWAVAQDRRQATTSSDAYERLYEPSGDSRR